MYICIPSTHTFDLRSEAGGRILSCSIWQAPHFWGPWSLGNLDLADYFPPESQACKVYYWTGFHHQAPRPLPQPRRRKRPSL